MTEKFTALFKNKTHLHLFENEGVTFWRENFPACFNIFPPKLHLILGMDSGFWEFVVAESNVNDSAREYQQYEWEKNEVIAPVVKPWEPYVCNCRCCSSIVV